ncbi:ABC transporter permease [Mesorhizobium hungaricum]|jgi:octopine/nopaline transport system permease protein|uniref:ABC transporter permease n=1 Tax=Mesorhizobium hungaricum TaxID=1566387 RepID=A0A1C2E2Y0_9HYPH|nr:MULTISPECIES: ABC transporter permease subunit [Mesorhizobium]MBN9235684.1 ABC transporter permease subunit [Mesorhizobium sp.]OCX21362.1 ABC transporter permease [Mesorhizobium hungaricum]
MIEKLSLVGFGPDGWGWVFAQAGFMTFLVAFTAFGIGLLVGTLVAWARISGSKPVQVAASAYVSVFRGVPDILIIYLFFFGGRQAITFVGTALGMQGPFEVSAFAAGALAVGLISSASQSEVLRGAYQAVPKGTIEAGVAVGMTPLGLFRRVIAPQALVTAIPGMGNQWQGTVKDSAVVSVTGLVETMRQVAIASGTTREYLLFAGVGAVIYLLITTVSDKITRIAEHSIRYHVETKVA